MTANATSTKAGLVVGLTSYNDAETIGDVSAAVRAGLARYVDGAASRVLLADGGSTDDTVARARAALGDTCEVVEVSPPRPAAGLPYHGNPGRARALHGILAAASALGSRVCVVLDASVLSLTSRWIEGLADPVVQQGVDFVSPCYRRHPYEGALTKSVVYPLFRALYGVRLRQPAAGEFACSSRLLERFLDQEFWDSDGVEFGIDLWLTTAAVSGDFQVGEAALGARAHRPRGEEALDLGTTVTQVIGSLFTDLERHDEVWQRVRSSRAVLQLGDEPPAPSAEAPTLEPERFTESFRLGYRELRDIWTWVLPPKTIVDLRKLADATPDRFRLDDELWARIVYDFAIGYRLRVLAREHLLRSFVPLYLGWFASFVFQVRDLTPEGADDRVEQLGIAFEAQKPYLIARWRWPERFRT